MKSKLKITASIVVALAFIILIALWSGWRDARLMESAERYENCVIAEYHTTPSAYYAEHGEYPYCAN